MSSQNNELSARGRGRGGRGSRGGRGGRIGRRGRCATEVPVLPRLIGDRTPCPGPSSHEDPHPGTSQEDPSHSQNNELSARGRGRGGRGSRGGRGGRIGRRGRCATEVPVLPRLIGDRTPCPGPSSHEDPHPGTSQEDPSHALEVVRAQRKLTAKRVAAMAPAQRQELVSKQKSAQLQRVLMPDAPPRKRASQRSSPPREACEILPTTFIKRGRTEMSQHTEPAAREVEIEVVLELPSTSSPRVEEYLGMDELRLVAMGADHSLRVEAAESLEDVELIDVAFPHELPPHTPPPPPHADLDGELDLQQSVAGPSKPPGQGAINPNETNFDTTIDEWIRLTDLSDVDDENVDEDEDSVPPPLVTGRDAVSEPAADSDLTMYQANVMRTEDRLNDNVMRSLVPCDQYDFNWTRDRQVFTGERETFTGRPGPTFEVTNQTRQIDVFYKMIDTDFVDLLCRETNRYAEQKLEALKAEDKLSVHARMQRWSPTDRNEMLTFLAFLILQGLYPAVTEKAYFCFNGFGTMPYFSRIMSYNRYLLIKTMLHFMDNDSLPPNATKLTKVQPITDYFNKKFSELYYPSQNIVIDESLLKWHGRLGFAQKILSKAAKVGIKTYELCESATGYLWKFFVYSGKEKQTDRQTNDDETQVDEDRHEDNRQDLYEDDRQVEDTDILEDRQTDEQCPTNATAKIVHSLVAPLFNAGHTLIMDNFYNCPLLARYLKKNKTDCFGTLRLNREFVPQSLKAVKRSEMRHGEVVASYCSDLSVMVWRDANLVSMISTYHHLQIGAIDKYHRLKYKPKIVLDYNASMGGVDRKDQVLAAQPVERKRTKIWYKKLFRRLFSTAIFNSFVIYKTANPNIDHRVFRTVLAEDLIKVHRHIDIKTEPRLFKPTTSALAVRPSPSGNNRPQLEHRHFPVKASSRHVRCWWCFHMFKKASRTSWKYLECDINLCIQDCFIAYHT